MGVLNILKKLHTRNRLGELMVAKGVLKPSELKKALKLQKENGQNLGQTLVHHDFISKSTLYSTLCQQWSLRTITATLTFLISFSVFGMKNNARAGSIKDVAAKITLTSAANTAFGDLHSYPSLYGMDEKRSTNIQPFTKWSAMFDRFERDISKQSNQGTLKKWQASLKSYQGLPLDQMAESVNALINQTPYITDDRVWGQSDYWASPIEFFKRGGDCEDFAIAKYASLRALGVPEDRMRIAIVQDLQKNIPHAVLVVYTQKGALVLDNQNKDILEVGYVVNRYKPIFSINRTAWWLHTKSDNTVVAALN